MKIGDSVLEIEETSYCICSAEAEFRSLADVTAELTWILGLVKEIGIDLVLPAEIYCDSKSALQIVANPV